MDLVYILNFALTLREFNGSKAEQRVLALIDELSATDVDDISDDFMNSLMIWTTSYLLHRIAGCKEEQLLRDAFIKTSAECLSPHVSRREAIDLLVYRFKCVRQHPSNPLDLLDEYHSGCKSQRVQYLAQHKSVENDSVFAVIALLANPPAPCLEPLERTGIRDGIIRVSNCYSDDLVWKILTNAFRQNLAFLLSHMTVRLRLANPLPLCTNPVHRYSCDSCNRVPIFVSFQAITPYNERNTMSLNRNYRGYDMCIPCAVHFVHEAQQRLWAALAVPPPLSRPFAVPNVRLTVQSAARSGKAVRLRVAISPQSARLCVWELPLLLMSSLPAPPSGDVWELPLPPPDWRDVCRVATAAAQSPFGDGDTCALCLTPLRDRVNYGTVVETECGHTFHAYYMSKMLSQPFAVGCPQCHDSAYLERMAMERVYDVELTLRECSAVSSDVCVAVAAMLTNMYTNPTNIVACEVIRLFPVSLLSCECQKPRTGMETLPFADSSVTSLNSLMDV